MDCFHAIRAHDSSALKSTTFRPLADASLVGEQARIREHESTRYFRLPPWHLFPGSILHMEWTVNCCLCIQRQR